jgi:hypothetical protein
MILLRHFPGFKGERQVSSTDESSFLDFGLQSFHVKRAIPFILGWLFAVAGLG